MKIIKELSKDEFKNFLYREMDLKDESLYKELEEEYIGVFQMTGNSAKKMVKDVKPDSFEELNACNALSRPGTAEFAPEFIRNKSEKKSSYPSQLDNIIEETNNIFLYQEQVMKVFHEIGGFTLEEADCIAGDVKICTDVGQLEIKDVVEKKINCKVLSLNTEKNVLEWKKVLSYFDKGEKEVIEIEIENGKKITCTEDHKIYTKNRGWVPAIELNKEDELFINHRKDI